MIQKILPPLCEHKNPLVFSNGYKAVCPTCKSFWDLDALKSNFNYDKSYPIQRLHFNPEIGRNKIRTLKYWLKQNKIVAHSLNICEVGFGGGTCLLYLQNNSKRAIGVELIKENITNAIYLGIKKEYLFDFKSLPDMLPFTIDLWIFQDSFEHISNPAYLLNWINNNSSNAARVLIVAPNAASISQKFMGRYWLHKIVDHSFHWSKSGLIDFFKKRGYILEKSFKPSKFVSLNTIYLHLANIIYGNQNKDIRKLMLPITLKFKFNIGEMGLLFYFISDD